jgi:imidazole glycerol phosphate synthase, glutamine amidotransferase subunit
MMTLLDYGAGNVRSVINAIERLGETVSLVNSPADIDRAERLVFPGVGNFGALMHTLRDKGLREPLLRYLRSGKPFFGICVALQALFESSDEAPDEPGLGLFPGRVQRFACDLAIPHIGWNGIKAHQASPLFHGLAGNEKFYFVHSYHVIPVQCDDILTTTDYGHEFVSAIQRGAMVATQFHPEKSGRAGLKLLENFLAGDRKAVCLSACPTTTTLAKRIIACLDVRANDRGDLVVTKGDQYDVREEGAVRNLGKPVQLAGDYYEQGADEITFLNITGFRDFPLQDMPMLEVLEQTSKNVFVPLTIGGGIRDFTDRDGRFSSALEVAARYFRSGADKISIGSDAVLIVEEVLQTGKATGLSSIEQIARVYGNQAVVISIDPRRVYVSDPDAVPHVVIATRFPGPNGEQYCWYQCTIRGGREGRPVDAVTLALVCEQLGAGEILLNCIDKDGTNSGFDIELINAVRSAVTIPVIASSGAGNARHFLDVFTETQAEAALAAGIFHRKELPIGEVKEYLRDKVEIRPLCSSSDLI